MATTSKLVVLSEPLRGQSFVLAQEAFTIGRSEDCNLCIPDATISGKHCTLERQENGTYILQDHESTNGSRVNGIRIQSQKLANSDILQLGGVMLLFETSVFSDQTSFNPSLSSECRLSLSRMSGQVPGSQMSNFSPFGSRSAFSRGGNRWVRIGFSGVGILLGLAILWVIFRLIKAVFVFDAPVSVPSLPWRTIGIILGVTAAAVALVILGWLAAAGLDKLAGRRREHAKVSGISPELQLADELKKVRDGLTLNSVYYANADRLGLQETILRRDTSAMAILKTGFHRVVVIDCKSNLQDGRVDWIRFCDALFAAMAAAFGIRSDSAAFHMEDISQILKDEEPSLFCFMNIQFLSKENLDSLRGFTQEQHRCLFATSGDYAGPLHKAVKL